MSYKLTTTLKSLLFTTLVINTISFAEEEHHGHGDHEWELGVSFGYANLKTEGEEGANLHLHLLKRLEGSELLEQFSVGFGLETIVTDEKHYGAMLTLAYHPMEDLVLSFSPGYEWSNHDGEGYESVYASHLEAAYSFDVSEDYHLGPVIGYSKTSETEHYTVGLHVGIPF